MDDYKLPNSKDEKEWFKCLTLSYKTLKGVPYNEKSWDRVHYARVAKSAKILISICGTLRQADACMVDLAEGFEASELNWTMETIVKHAHDWMAKKGRQNSVARNACRTGLFKALADAGRSAESPPESEGTRALADSKGSELYVEETH